MSWTQVHPDDECETCGLWLGMFPRVWVRDSWGKEDGPVYCGPKCAAARVAAINQMLETMNARDELRAEEMKNE